jgi:hypothetical protein
LADTIALIPTTLFILWQSLADWPQPDISRQRQWLEDCLKVLLLAATVGLITKELKAVIPWVAVWLLSNIALLRTLRHEPAVQNKLGFHAMNLLIVGSVPAVAGCLGSKAVINTVSTPLITFGRNVLIPILIALLWLPLTLIEWLLALLLPDYVAIRLDYKKKIPLKGIGKIREYEDFQIPAWLKVLCCGLLLFAGVSILFVFLRRLLKRQDSVTNTLGNCDGKYIFEKKETSNRIEVNSGVKTIRKQYRMFLNLCRKKGLTRTLSSTSQEIDNMARKIPAFHFESQEIREIYIQARYAAKVDFRKAQRMKSLVKKAKKNMEKS